MISFLRFEINVPEIVTYVIDGRCEMKPSVEDEKMKNNQIVVFSLELSNPPFVLGMRYITGFTRIDH